MKLNSFCMFEKSSKRFRELFSEGRSRLFYGKQMQCFMQAVIFYDLDYQY